MNSNQFSCNQDTCLIQSAFCINTLFILVSSFHHSIHHHEHRAH